jgi:hypothetical protein
LYRGWKHIILTKSVTNTQLISPAIKGHSRAWQALFEKLNETAAMRIIESSIRVSKRYHEYSKKLRARASQLLYPVTEQEVRLLQRNRSPLSEAKVRSALERDYYTCTCCGQVQVWILDNKKEMFNRHYRAFGDSYYSRTNIALHVHHIVPVPFGSDDPDNLAVVCRECHRAISVDLRRYQTKVFEEFDSILVDLATRRRIDRIHRTRTLISVNNNMIRDYRDNSISLGL